MNEDNRRVDELLAEKFRQLLPDQEAPEQLKTEVFRTLDFLEMFGEIADLYTAKFSAAEMGLLDTIATGEDDTKPTVDKTEEE